MSYVANRINETACTHYESYKTQFSSLEQFKSALNDCYGFVAWHAANEFEKMFGTSSIGLDDPRRKVLSIAPIRINSKDFGKILANFKDTNGKWHRQPYGLCLDALEDDHILYISDSYSNAVGQSFPKSYGIENSFFINALEDSSARRDSQRPSRILRAIRGHYPLRLLKGKIREAKLLYASLKPFEEITCILPEGWENQCNDTASFNFNPKLSIDNLLSGLNLFHNHKPPTVQYGRSYDWFALAPSQFRQYLFVDGNHYREIVDCPSGIFWMLGIAGFREHKVPKEEALRLIDQCFTGHFYTNISGVAQKTPALKKSFMKAINTNSNALHYASTDPQIKRISQNLGIQYPNLWAWIGDKRNTLPVKVGLENHILSTEIEKQVMTTLTTHFEEMGYQHLRRVHDALWGVQDIPNASDSLHQIAIDYLLNTPKY